MVSQVATNGMFGGRNGTNARDVLVIYPEARVYVSTATSER
jgi:hypothetical protein